MIESLTELKRALEGFPDLPIMVMVDYDCVPADEYRWWEARISAIEVQRMCEWDFGGYDETQTVWEEDSEDLWRTYEDYLDTFDNRFENERYENPDIAREEFAKDTVKNLPWKEVIVLWVQP